MNDPEKKVTIRQLMLITVVAAVVFAIDSALRAPVLLTTMLLAVLPAFIVRSMYRSGLRSAGVDPDLRSGTGVSRVLVISVLVFFLAFFFVPFIGFVISSFSAIR